jgi:hypothetical protein
MPQIRSAKTSASRKPRARRPRFAAGRSLSGAGRRAFQAVRAAPWEVQLLVIVFLAAMMFLTLNWVYQVIRKPAEMFFPVSGVLNKTPTETWRRYGALFREHATAVIAPEFLAAMAQVEGAGNPVARTYWRWQLSWNPLEVYQPASSAVGMYQITNAAFRDARRYCIHYNVVVEDGPWNDFRSCWFNSLYTRTIPSHAIELTSATLDRSVANTLARHRIASATLRQKQDLAAVIHLCGPGTGNLYARRGFSLTAGQRCGDHDPAAYLTRVNAIKSQFLRLAAAEELH